LGQQKEKLLHTENVFSPVKKQLLTVEFFPLLEIPFSVYFYTSKIPSFQILRGKKVFYSPVSQTKM